jgi:hypothetical protein
MLSPRTGTARGGEHPVIGSVMLAHAVIPDLMVFSLLHVDQFDYVLDAPHGFTGFNEGNNYVEINLHNGRPPTTTG